MHPLRVYSVTPNIPKGLESLWQLANNYWFSWNAKIEDIFAHIDPRLWNESYKNPIWFLNRVPQGTLESLARDETFLVRLAEARQSLERYLSRKHMAVPLAQDEPGQPVVAYFSMEYGISSCLPIYSGGLGMLAGDHLKSASDLNLPLVAIGLAYKEGYFRQYLTPDGWQQERYPVMDFEEAPLTLLRGEDGNPLLVTLELAGEPLSFILWKAQVGRIRLFLLDTNISENPQHFRQITSRLYGGGLEMRLWQEFLLGVGGIKTLRALNLRPKVIHMNEGHSAFAGLERIRNYMAEDGLPFEAAMEMTASSSVFTTHTPVPAGNDRFPPDLMQRYFESYAREMGLAFKVLLALGREDPRDESEHFCMTVLALRLSRFNNGVSELHGHVSRNMWKRVWPQYPIEDVPIGSITNGAHGPTWVAPDIALLYDRYLGENWREDSDCARVWAMAENISEAELWRTHERLRARLVDFVRQRLVKQLAAKGVRRQALEIAEEVLNPDALTIGFARRFATYKRANLLFRDPDRLIKIISNPARPVQFIFAGKAHPADNDGKKIIQEILQFCRRDECRYKMIFLEDYDMEIAKAMVQGCDVWLNNPRRPLEACGTSGMKAMLNGVIQLSALDGWWAEAYRPDNSLGYAIGSGEEYDDAHYQDFVESQTLYNILENYVLPEFYDRGHGDLPRTWVRKMKRALQYLGPVFTAHRMVSDYALTAYKPAAENHDRLVRDHFEAAKELAAWRMDIMMKWSGLLIKNIETTASDRVIVGQALTVEADVHLNDLKPSDVKVEIYAGPVDHDGAFATRFTTEMKPSGAPKDGWQKFKGQAQPENAGRFGFTVRLLPHHPLLLDPHSLGLIRWAE